MKRWVPFGVALAVAFIVQAGLVGWLIAERALLLKNGHEVRLSVVPVDPRDLLRGDYIVLSYEISQLSNAALGGDDAFSNGDAIYVTLARAGNDWQATAIAHAPPENGTWIRGTVRHVQTSGRDCAPGCKTYGVDYSIGKFFLPEGTGRDLEALRNGRAPRRRRGARARRARRAQAAAGRRRRAL